MSIKNFKFTPTLQVISLLLLAIALNFNTLFGIYTLDDAVVMSSNTMVEKGISGIPEIFTSNLLDGSKGSHANLTQARYRPFSTATFAVEYQFFGRNPMVSHLINLCIFLLLVLVLFRLLRTSIFQHQHEYLAFVTCLIYVAHPIHTEVIANVKSRDELITFLFVVLSLKFFIQYSLKQSYVQLSLALLCFFIALLTRESAITFVAVVPLVMYYFYNRTIKQSLLYTLPLVLMSVLFLAIRYFATRNEHDTTPLIVLNSPFMWATASQAFATKTFILLKYIGLLFFPHPLSWDYGFNQIPYISLASVEFVVSLVVIVALLVYGLMKFKSKSIYSFSILYYFVTISLFSNFLVDVGTPLSERFLFQPSLAFCIIIASLYLHFEQKSQLLSTALLAVVVILFSIKTVVRNRVWENNETLNLTDVATAPNSERTNQYATELYILKANKETNIDLKRDYFRKAAYYGERCIQIYPDNPIATMELGSAYFGLQDYYKTADYWTKTYRLIPNDPQAKYWVEFLSNVFNKQGNGFSEHGDRGEAINCFKKATQLNYDNVEAWYNLGGHYYLNKDSVNGSLAWETVKRLSPNHPLDMKDFEN